MKPCVVDCITVWTYDNGSRIIKRGPRRYAAEVAMTDAGFAGEINTGAEYPTHAGAMAVVRRAGEIRFYAKRARELVRRRS